jgi:hypothetical protein
MVNPGGWVRTGLYADAEEVEVEVAKGRVPVLVLAARGTCGGLYRRWFRKRVVRLETRRGAARIMVMDEKRKAEKTSRRKTCRDREEVEGATVTTWWGSRRGRAAWEVDTRRFVV